MKILYLMAIDWYWIKQRPQFLALNLNLENEVNVYYLSEVFTKIQLQENAEKPSVCKKVWAIPFRDRKPLFMHIQKCLFDCRIRDYSRYHVIWLAHPALVKYIPKKYEGIIVYDCMDNHVAMCSNKGIKRTFNMNESELVQRADLIFVSSKYLLNHICHFGGEKKTVLLRNGYETREIRRPGCIKNKKEKYKIGYIGTLSEWFDKDLLIKSLQELKNIEYHLLGPKINFELNDIPGIVDDGIREHNELFEYSGDIDCLIMPFLVNDVVEAVDPVKLYEYISMGKCIVSVYYDEIQRFEKFVYFYRSYGEYIELIRKLSLNGFMPKYTSQEQDNFLKESSWEVRGDLVKKELYKQIGRV